MGAFLRYSTGVEMSYLSQYQAHTLSNSGGAVSFLRHQNWLAESCWLRGSSEIADVVRFLTSECYFVVSN